VRCQRPAALEPIRPATLLLVLSAASLYLGCRPQQAPLPDDRILVGWSFAPDSAEHSVVRSLLRNVLATRSADQSFIDGQVYRFGGTASRSRYLLETSEGDETSQPIITLYVLESDRTQGAVSAPFSTGVADYPWWYEPLAIADLDKDSLSDFAFCVWESGVGKGTPRAVGYTGGWYEIAVPDSLVGSCAQH
jgi:hypothetical protein